MMVEDTLVRAGLYRFFAAVFRYPDEEEWRFIDETITEARDCLVALRVSTDAFDEFAEAWSGHTREALEPIYVRTFLNALPSVIAAPYESLYRAEEQRLPVLASVNDFYERCGVVVSDDLRDMPDHIATELEFMQYLCVEAQTMPEHRRIIVEAEREFLRGHLLPFAQALAAALPEGVYHHGAGALREFVEGELVYLEGEMTTVGGVA